MVVRNIGTVGQLALLSTDKCRTIPTKVVYHRTHTAIVAVHALLLPINFIHYDVQHAADTFGIVLCTGIGNNFNRLDRRGRHRFEYLRRIGREHYVRLSVYIDFERTLSVHGNVVLSVYRYHRNLAQHIEHCLRFAVHIILYIVAHLVGFHLYEWLLCYYFHTLHHLFIVLHQDSTKA